MSIRDILIRSISGYIFVVPGIILYFWCLAKSGRKQPPLHIAAVFVFCYYLIGVLTMTGIGKLTAFSPRLVLVPFLGMVREPVDSLLNVILFLPLGFLLPTLYRKYDRFTSAVWTGFLLSLSIETVQMFGRGATDVNDLITNTVGACLGYFLYALLFKKARKKSREKLRANQIRDGLEVLFFTAYAFGIMVTVQPLVIHNLFRLG